MGNRILQSLFRVCLSNSNISNSFASIFINILNFNKLLSIFFIIKIKFLSIGICGLLLLALASSNMQAQEYHPFPEENAFWTVNELNEYYQDENFLYTIKGDTILNDKLYKKIYKLNDIPYTQDTLWTLHSFIRQDNENKKVFFIRHYMAETIEKLGYDFDVNIGDTAIMPAFDYANIGDSIFKVVDSGWDSTLLDNGEYRKNYLYASLFQYSNFDLFVIESVGEQRAPFPNLFYYDPFHQSLLFCLIVNGVQLYGSSPEVCGFFVDINDKQNVRNILCYPIPATKFLKIDLSEIIPPENSVIIITNILGVTVYSQSLDINEGELTLDVSFLNSGIYFLKIIDTTHRKVFKTKIIISH